MNVCPSAPQGAIPGESISCDAVMGSCNQALLSGGYGPGGDTLPADIGIPIGLGAAQHVIISRHFYNPTGLSNVYDNGTGYEIWYTTQLRPYVIGQLGLGTAQFKIPPQTNNYAVNALCSSDCTNNFPAGGLTVTSIFFHMHSLGAKIYTKVIRSGEYMIELGRVDPWDPSSPGVNTYFKLLPGDTLITSCVYSNPNTYSVGFGSSLTDEMCLATLTYYPKVEIYQCADMPEGLGSNFTVPAACITYCSGAGASSIPECRACNTSLPRTYCSNAMNVSITYYDEPDRGKVYIPYQGNTNCQSGTQPSPQSANQPATQPQGNDDTTESPGRIIVPSLVMVLSLMIVVFRR